MIRLCALLLLLALVGWTHGRADTFYVDAGRGNDANAGTADAPFQTIGRAMTKVDGPGGTVHLSPDGGPYREIVHIKKGGTPAQPLVIEGHGSVVNLGQDITRGPWTDTGNGFRLETPVIPNGRFNLVSPVFVNGLPLFTEKPKVVTPKAWHGGGMSYDPQNHLIAVFPRGLSPANSVVVLSAPGMDCGVEIAGASNVTIRDLTCVFSGNDGFGIHGNCQNIVLERVKGLFNSDQGISAHETCQVTSTDSEVAFDGSFGGSVADVQQANTTYRMLRIHQNRNVAFQFQQGHHLLQDVVSYGNGGPNLPFASDSVQLIDCQDLGPYPEAIPTVSPDVVAMAYSPQNATAESKKTYDEKDRLGRFLQFRPPPTPFTPN
jgi:hypothetical protein